MRIQKYLSEQKILSRREAEEYIKDGLIKLNGQIVKEFGVQIDPAKDKIEVLAPKRGNNFKMTVALYKPRGLTCSKSTNEGKTIFDVYPQFKNLNTVGRLDKESEGLILLSNDGTITSAVTSEEHLIEKEYEVKVRERVTQSKLMRMAEGMNLNDGPTLPAKTKALSGTSFKITLREGRNHQIRRMTNALHLTISSLRRTRIGPVTLKGLTPGASRLLSAEEILKLKNS